MGEAMGERGPLMRPPKAAEDVIALLIPPACREEVTGDLHERYTSLLRYLLDAGRTVPLVIVSRIRRTADPQVILMEAFILYLSFLAAAWYEDRMFLLGPLAFLRLAIPSAMALLGSVLEGAYARPGRRSALKPFRGPLLGIGAALLSQMVLAAGSAALTLPRWSLLWGSALSLLLAPALHALFPPVTDRPLGAAGPALWLKQDGEPLTI